MRAVVSIATALIGIAAIACVAAENGAPSNEFNLKNLKLQLPGPKEVKQLKAYSSRYFYLNDKSEMCFHLDAAEKGTTPNAHYVRAELRHMLEWPTEESHAITGDFRVVSHLSPNKVTVLQIHGIKPDHSDAPPLLRIAVNNGDLVAALKTDGKGDKTEMVTLKKGLGDHSVRVNVAVVEGDLRIVVDGVQKYDHDLGYWKYFNYFKAGCYPQANKGTADVYFKALKVE